MPIGMLGIYCVLFVCVCVHRIFGNGYLGYGLTYAMKFCRIIDLGVH